jgi:hypothetical protein
MAPSSDQNQYVYCDNQPNLKIDPFGLDAYLTIAVYPAGPNAPLGDSYGHAWIIYTPLDSQGHPISSTAYGTFRDDPKANDQDLINGNIAACMKWGGKLFTNRDYHAKSPPKDWYYGIIVR